MIELSASSKGIDWLLLHTKWTKNGLLVSMKVAPQVEEFFQNTSANQLAPLSHFGGQSEWNPVEGQPELQSYVVHSENFETANTFRLGRPGGAFLTDNYPGKINLSFIHLVGASKTAGTQFVMKMPYSSGGKLNLRMNIERAMSEFVKQYLTFGSISIRVFSQED